MSKYAIIFKKSAFKELRSLPNKEVTRIIQAKANLSENPCPTGCKKWFVGQIGEVPAAISQGKTIEELKDALQLIFETNREETASQFKITSLPESR